MVVNKLFLSEPYSFIPLKGKKSICRWKTRIENPYNSNQLQEYIDKGIESFGLICGYNNVECIDIDTKVLPIESQDSFNEDFLKNIPKAIKNKLMVQKM